MTRLTRVVAYGTVMFELVCIVGFLRLSSRKHLKAVIGHLFEDVMATYHPPGIAEEVGGTSSITQWAFRQLRKN